MALNGLKICCRLPQESQTTLPGLRGICGLRLTLHWARIHPVCPHTVEARLPTSKLMRMPVHCRRPPPGRVQRRGVIAHVAVGRRVAGRPRDGRAAERNHEVADSRPCQRSDHAVGAVPGSIREPCGVARAADEHPIEAHINGQVSGVTGDRRVEHTVDEDAPVRTVVGNSYVVPRVSMAGFMTSARLFVEK